MCGIIGLVRGAGAMVPVGGALAMAERLLLLSESRGKEAAGLAITLPDTISVLRMADPASEFLRSEAYRQFRDETVRALSAPTPRGFGLIGHARLVTNGLQAIDVNNQPVVTGGTVCVHNGIVVNDAQLWRSEPGIRRTAEVDTEVISAMLDARVCNGASIAEATQHVFSRISGEASIATLFSSYDELLVATNTGSLFLGINPSAQLSFVASEHAIAKALLNRMPGDLRAGFGEITQIRAGEAAIIDTATAALRGRFALNDSASPRIDSVPAPAPRRISSNADRVRTRWQALRRCSKCVLLETMPFIEFDAQGVCNYCRSFVPQLTKGREALERALQPYRKGNGEPDCIIAFSGGRDSSYALHLLKTELGMTPIAYTYDWGMVTDLARRNQARLCGKLGVEHIWVSADIKQKRRNVKKNVEAWLRKPQLGMVPLFMAGDKQFMYHAKRLMNETGIRLMVYATNYLEKTDFKVGFCNIRTSADEIQLNKISWAHKARLAAYYGASILSNPGYINSSLFDTFTAFLSYYFVKQDFLYLFNYLEWDEDTINKVLVESYDWEFAKDTKTSWRIGDGTAPFYNYIYRTVAGFSEYETFRSNQIRAGVLDRADALRLVESENHARYESMQEYCRMIGVDFDYALRAIDRIPKLY